MENNYNLAIVIFFLKMLLNIKYSLFLVQLFSYHKDMNNQLSK